MTSFIRSGEYFELDFKKIAFVNWSFLLYPLPPAREDQDHLLWRYEFARPVWAYLFQEFDFMLAHRGDVGSSIAEFLLYPPFRKKGRFLWLVGVCALLWVLWSERNNRVFRGVKRDPCDVWVLVKVQVSF